MALSVGAQIPMPLDVWSAHCDHDCGIAPPNKQWFGRRTKHAMNSSSACRRLDRQCHAELLCSKSMHSRAPQAPASDPPPQAPRIRATGMFKMLHSMLADR